MKELKVACVQMKSSNEKTKNLALMVDMLKRASKAKAKVVVFPEHALYLGTDYFGAAETLRGPTISSLARIGRQERLAIVLGSFAEASRDVKKVYNTTVAIDSSGAVCSTYRKRHLFKAQLKNKKKPLLDETAMFLGGEKK